MEKIDRLGWAAGLSFVSHGARIGIRVSDISVLERVSARLPPSFKVGSTPQVDSLYSIYVAGESSAPNVRRYHLLYVGSVRIVRSHRFEDVLDTLESTLHF